MESQTDVVIVGAGPIGLELAVALKRHGIDYLHFDAKQIGHTISWFPPQTRFFSSNERIAIAGVPLMTPDQTKATREQYLTYLRGVVRQFDLKVRTYEKVIGIEPVAGGREGFRIITEKLTGRSITRCRRLVLCTGGTDRPRRLGIPGEDLPHVSHYFGDPHTYFDQRVLIVGGKNSAVEAALRCHATGAHVSLSYRRDELPEKSIKYWLMPEIRTLLKEGRIRGHFGTTPVQITPSHVALSRGSERIDVEADFVLLLIGYEQDNTLFKLAGIDLTGECQAPVHDPQTMLTNVPNVFVAGTAVGGTQDKYRVFIENCHVHVDRIVHALLGKAPPPADRGFEQPES